MELTTAIRALHPRTVFRISRGARTEARNVFVRVERDGIVGFGEASPNAFYGETAEGVDSKLRGLSKWMSACTVGSVADIERIWQDIWPLVQPSRAAQCALDVALWDWLAKKNDSAVTELALDIKPHVVATFCTIGISTHEELATKIAELASFPFIKIKMDQSADLNAVKDIRERTVARLAVDANCAWSGHDVPALSQKLAEIGVEFIEQPLPPGEDARMPEIIAASALPILADESCVLRDDVERMPGRFSGFNIKLVKCGGLTPALTMLRRGRELDLKIMVGCMLESSALISAGAVIAQQTDYADLDGAWLIADDPFRGWRFKRGELHPPKQTNQDECLIEFSP